MQITVDETMQALRWAQSEATANEVVGMFWEKLCAVVDEPPCSSADHVLSELRLYGGNSIANIFRDEGIPYANVAYDVAEILRPLFDNRAYQEGDIDACESFVLRRMEVKEDDVRRLSFAVDTRGNDEAEQVQLVKAGSLVALEGTGIIVAQKVAQAAATAAARRAMAETGKQVAKKAAQKAAEQAAREVAKQVLVRVMVGLNIVLAAWTVVSIAGPARRVIIPGVTYVALLRKLYRASQRGL